MPITYYTSDHEWLVIYNGVATIGITDHAQDALGVIVYVELPDVGLHCGAGDSIATIESVKAASDIYAPVNGEVIEINESLDDSPEMVNDAAESDGWFMKIRIEEPLDVSSFMTLEAYLTLLGD